MRGQWVILDATATWCEACGTVTDELVTFARAHPDVQIVTLAADDNLEVVTRATAARGASWPVIPMILTNSVRFDYRFDQLPDTVIINPDGVVAAVFEHNQPVTAAAIDDVIEGRR